MGTSTSLLLSLRHLTEAKLSMSDTSETDLGRLCPWCSAAVGRSATHCPTCGDALAQRESIDGLSITGVTTVDPALEAYAARPLPMPLAVPSGTGPVSNVAGTMARQAALAAPYGSSLRTGRPVDPSTVGKPAAASLEAAEQMDREDESS